MSDVGNRQAAEDHYYSALDFYAEGRPNEAIEQYKKAVELDPAFTDAMHGLARAYQDLNRLDEAYQSGDLAGYFEPANPAERKLIPRWYLAPSQAISVPEIALLLEVILDEPPGMVKLAAAWITASEDASGSPAQKTC